MKPVRAGEYDKRVTIETISTRVNPDGSPLEVWTEYARRWAKILPLGQGREYLLAAQIMADVSLVLELRFCFGVTPRHRVYFGGRYFEISHVENVQEKGRVTRLYCKEKVS